MPRVFVGGGPHCFSRRAPFLFLAHGFGIGRKKTRRKLVRRAGGRGEEGWRRELQKKESKHPNLEAFLIVDVKAELVNIVGEIAVNDGRAPRAHGSAPLNPEPRPVV
jgi:hypothetical protein